MCGGPRGLEYSGYSLELSLVFGARLCWGGGGLCDIPWNTGSAGTLYTLISPLCLRALVRCDVVCCQVILV